MPIVLINIMKTDKNTNSVFQVYITTVTGN